MTGDLQYEGKYLIKNRDKALRANEVQIAAGQKENPEIAEISGFYVLRDRFRYTLKIEKNESWSGFELFQLYFLLSIAHDYGQLGHF